MRVCLPGLFHSDFLWSLVKLPWLPSLTLGTCLALVDRSPCTGIILPIYRSHPGGWWFMQPHSQERNGIHQLQGPERYNKPSHMLAKTSMASLKSCGHCVKIFREPW